MKHGLLSRESLVKGESKADLVHFGKRLRAQLAPAGELEHFLVDRIVSTAWRLRRLVAVETMLFDREHNPDDAFDSCGREKIGMLSRYEVTLERSLYRALHELQRLQAARDGQAVPPPKMVDMEVSVFGPNEAHELAPTQGSRAEGSPRRDGYLLSRPSSDNGSGRSVRTPARKQGAARLLHGIGRAGDPDGH